MRAVCQRMVDRTEADRHLGAVPFRDGPARAQAKTGLKLSALP
jgi:hypothetical protein